MPAASRKSETPPGQAPAAPASPQAKCFSYTLRDSPSVHLAPKPDRFLDKGAQDAVLYQTNILDNAPYLSGNNVALAVVPKPELPNSIVTATFDNFEQGTYEVPQVGIERAVRLSWPATGMNFAVEGAPTMQGPWLPVQDADVPGCQNLTVPANDSMRFFRLQQSP